MHLWYVQCVIFLPSKKILDGRNLTFASIHKETGAEKEKEKKTRQTRETETETRNTFHTIQKSHRTTIERYDYTVKKRGREKEGQKREGKRERKREGVLKKKDHDITYAV